ncbi:MAG: hypothetical protein KDD38_02090 [Bdellovibrionales bacterium]|nr:hypothetical protein [Bdellovibrionales bacterium]
MYSGERRHASCYAGQLASLRCRVHIGAVEYLEMINHYLDTQFNKSILKLFTFKSIFSFLTFFTAFSFSVSASAQVKKISEIQKYCTSVAQSKMESIDDKLKELAEKIKVESEKGDVSRYLASYKKTLNLKYKTPAEQQRVMKDHFTFKYAVTLEQFRERGQLAQNKLDEGLKKTEANMKRSPAQCSPVDLRGQLPPVRNQDSMGWCFAFTAADLLSFKSGENISPKSLAVHSVKMKLASRNIMANVSSDEKKRGTESMVDNDFLESLYGPISYSEYEGGGSTRLAIVQAPHTIICTEQELPSENFNDVDLLCKLRYIEKVANELPKYSLNNFSKSRCNEIMPALESFPNLTLSEVADGLRLSSRADVISNLTDQNCNKKESSLRLQKKLKDIQVSTLTRGEGVNGQHLVRSIDRNFKEGRPSGVSYSARVLTNPAWSDRTVDGHASVIVGRRYNDSTGQCEYLLRNSWGSAWKPKRYESEGGYAWIPQASLARSMRQVQWVE